MKLHKKIVIAGETYPLTKEDVRLDLFNPGSAVFDVAADKAPAGVVHFYAGYNPQAMETIFVGYVDSSFAIDKKQQRVFCRELNAALTRLVPVSLRNVTLQEVLAAISKETGLDFVTPEQPYSSKKAPAFYSIGSGYYCMDSMAEVFAIPKYIWQQQGDGKTYVGSWEHSYWVDRPIELPTEMLASSGVANRARIPAFPKLRPGAMAQGLGIVTKVFWEGEQQNITWNKNPWGNRWTNRSNV